MNWLTRLNPRNWFGRGVSRSLTYDQWAALGLVAPAPAGVPVTTETALGISTVYCADRVIAEDVATLPKLVYQGPEEDRDRAPNHPVQRLLTSRPNPEMTAPVFWSAFQHNANIWGYAAAEIVRDGAGAPVELWPLHSPSVRMDRVGGQLRFFASSSGGETSLHPDDVFFVPGHSPDGTIGFQLLHVARMTLGIAVASQRYGAAVFRNGIRPSGALEYTGVLSDGARENLKASWRMLYGGPDNAGEVPILEEGLKWNGFNLATNEQQQLIEVSEFLVSEICRYFNISPVKVHQLGRATWGNLETLNTDHVQTCLRPWFAKHDAEVEVKLLREGSGFTCRTYVEELLRADIAVRFAAWQTALVAGFMTVNEVRARENLKPMPGGDALKSTTQPAAAPKTEPTNGPAQPDRPSAAE